MTGFTGTFKYLTFFVPRILRNLKKTQIACGSEHYYFRVYCISADIFPSTGLSANTKCSPKWGAVLFSCEIGGFFQYTMIISWPRPNIFPLVSLANASCSNLFSIYGETFIHDNVYYFLNRATNITRLGLQCQTPALNSDLLLTSFY